MESAVGAHLYNTGIPDINLHYWRKSPHEVDFVLVKGRKLVGIEVKSSLYHDCHGGLLAFEKEFFPEKAFLVGGQGIPLAEFLGQPADHWFEADGCRLPNEPVLMVTSSPERACSRIRNL